MLFFSAPETVSASCGEYVKIIEFVPLLTGGVKITADLKLVGARIYRTATSLAGYSEVLTHTEGTNTEYSTYSANLSVTAGRTYALYLYHDVGSNDTAYCKNLQVKSEVRYSV